MVDWAELDHNLLMEIAERIPSIESYESFGRVCRSWGTAAREGHVKQTVFEGPWLMFADKDEDNENSTESIREFSSVSLGIKRSRKIFLPEASKQRCLSCKDWLLVCSSNEIDVSLLHPLSRVQIRVPKFDTLSHYIITELGLFIEKAVLSANPSITSNFIVMIICGLDKRLAFWKSGDKSWTSIDFWRPTGFVDIIYFNNKLYGLDGNRHIIMCDIHGTNPTKLVKVFANEDLPFLINNPRGYLVELPGGKLLQIHRHRDFGDDYYHTDEIRVFEVNIEDNSYVEVKELGNIAVFVGYNTTFYVECSEFNNCKPNSIYFSDDDPDLFMGVFEEDPGGGRDMGIYNLADGSIQPFFGDDLIKGKLTPPTWIGPGF